MCDRTGSHTHQQATPPVRPFRTSAPVETHKRLDPTNPDFCNEDNSKSTTSGRGLWAKDVQVVSNRRDGDGSPFGNGQFGVHSPGGTNNWFSERQDVILYRRALYVDGDGVNPQGFLCEEIINFAPD